MKPSEALKIARVKIETGEKRFICWALPINNAAGETVRAYMFKALGGYTTYDSWLYLYRTEIPLSMIGDEGLREGRLQWIDWMIEQYEAIGQ